MGDIVRDFEPELRALTLRPFDDGRFIVLRDGKSIFDMDRTEAFPKYEAEIKPRLGSV